MIYLDHAATTPVHEEVLKEMYELERKVIGNPSSTHRFGREARSYLNKARNFIAQSIGAKDREIIFTSGGTESNNLAVIGTAKENEHKGNHIITTAQEHHAILDIMEYLQSQGFHVTYLRVNEEGLVDVNELERALTNQTILVSVMTANNETGVLQPIKEIGALLADHQAYFHTDAVQAYSMIDLNVKDLGIDLLTASAHKLNGPKGIGFLYINEETSVKQLQYGGLQERQIRGGTENLFGAYGFYLAAKIAMEKKEENFSYYQKLNELFLQRLKDEEVEFSINGNRAKALPSILNLSFPHTKVEQLLTNLDLAGVAASSGSACSAGALEPSHVLKAMFGKRSEKIHNSIRFSFGSLNDEANVKEAASRLSQIVKELTGEN